MSVISLGHRISARRLAGDILARRVEEQRKRTEASVLASSIATSRYEKAVVELIRDRERLAEAGL